MRSSTTNFPIQITMASITNYPDPAEVALLSLSNNVELYIRTDDAQREQPVDCNYRPDLPEADKRCTLFEPFVVGQPRKPHITQLPSTPLLLFQAFIPISLTKSWAKYKITTF
jgi:hypothetical protein